MRFYRPNLQGASPQQKSMNSSLTKELVRLRGSGRRPDAPRELLAQSGARKVLLTWSTPARMDDVVRWQIARDVESNIVDSIDDVTKRSCEVSAQSGASPPVYQFYVRSVSSAGLVSRWASVTGSATAEAAAPSDPSPPAEFSKAASGGGGTTTTDNVSYKRPSANPIGKGRFL